MRKIFVLIATAFICLIAHSQDVESYFKKIRNNRASLTAFIQQMPKGGDLHHHYTGSVYAETYIAFVVEEDYYINTNTLQVLKNRQPGEEWKRFSRLKEDGMLPKFRQALMQKWSVKDYNQVSYPSDKQFFETFPAFGIAADATLVEGLREIKKRAISENVSYIETMFMSIPCPMTVSEPAYFNTRLRELGNLQDERATLAVLDSFYALLHSVKTITDCAVEFNTSTVERLHKNLGLDDEKFTIRYQAYVNRSKDPLILFKDLIVGFESVQRSELMVGVNIVAPEDGEVSMNDYWLHMMMFKYCSSKYPGVKYSMHAGELTLGLVKPEELTWHINAAVRIAGAHRIGHGVDIAWEKDAYDLLRHMRSRSIPVEINLTSNEFILKVKGESHPINIYREYKVPIIISTDDAGVLRSNLTEQYVLLINRYPDISYLEMKKYIYNSIDFSFVKGKQLRERLRKDLDRRFTEFENKFKGDRQ